MNKKDNIHGETKSYKDYRLEPVYRCGTSSQHEEAIDFWLAQKALIKRERCEQRANELVFLVRRQSGELAGMSTAAKTKGIDGKIYLAFRMFLHKDDRVPFLMREISLATYRLLRDYPWQEQQPAGMIIVTENRKLMRPGMHRYFLRYGLSYRGKTQGGKDVWHASFEPSAN